VSSRVSKSPAVETTCSKGSKSPGLLKGEQVSSRVSKCAAVETACSKGSKCPGLFKGKQVPRLAQG